MLAEAYMTHGVVFHDDGLFQYGLEFFVYLIQLISPDMYRLTPTKIKAPSSNKKLLFCLFVFAATVTHLNVIVLLVTVAYLHIKLLANVLAVASTRSRINFAL